jgi:hypothetical protein
VISRLDVKLRTPTPAGGVDELPAPWVSRTPHNPLEASSQSIFIKNRIFRHQGSSPTSILYAVDQFAKGTQGIMHQIALLRSENQILRQENEILSKRRRAKKKASPRRSKPYYRSRAKCVWPNASRYAAREKEPPEWWSEA